MPDLIAGFFTGAALIIAIGAQNAFLLRQGLRREYVLPLILICATADALLIAAGIAGLGALMHATPSLLNAAKFGGAAFLFVYGFAAAWRALRPQFMTVDASVTTSLSTAIATCLAFTLLNPHVYLDTVILVGSLAAQRGDQGQWLFGGGAAMASFVWFFSLGFGARLLAPLFSRPIAWRILDTFIALIMTGLAANLLLPRDF